MTEPGATRVDQAAAAPACPLCRSAAPQPFAVAEGRTYHACGVCRLVSLAPGQRPAAEAEAAEYALHQNDPADPGYRAFLDQLAAPMAARLPPGARGLDFGCGPGPTLSIMLSERGFPCADYDPLFRPGPDLLDQSWDFITCSEVVEHFHDPGAEFERLDRALAPGGLLGIMTSLLTPEIDFAVWPYRRQPSHVVFYRPETMAWIAGWRGWSMEILGGNIVFFTKPGGAHARSA